MRHLHKRLESARRAQCRLAWAQTVRVLPQLSITTATGTGTGTGAGTGTGTGTGTGAGQVTLGRAWTCSIKSCVNNPSQSQWIFLDLSQTYPAAPCGTRVYQLGWYTACVQHTRSYRLLQRSSDTAATHKRVSSLPQAPLCRAAYTPRPLLALLPPASRAHQC